MTSAKESPNESPTATKLSLSTLNACSDAEFTAALGGVFERSPWIAARAAQGRPYKTLGALHEAMTRAVEAAGREAQLELIRAHPDLAGKAALAGELSSDSIFEQVNAGLGALSHAEYTRFHTLNAAYKARFGFPFVLAVKGHDKTSILAAFETRLHNGSERERTRALAEIYQIARFRLEALLGDV